VALTHLEITPEGDLHRRIEDQASPSAALAGDRELGSPHHIHVGEAKIGDLRKPGSRVVVHQDQGGIPAFVEGLALARPEEGPHVVLAEGGYWLDRDNRAAHPAHRALGDFAFFHQPVEEHAQ
jgi:hypothetical protein